MNRLYLRDAEVDAIRSVLNAGRYRSERDLFEESIATGGIHSAEMMRDCIITAVVPGAFSE